MVLIFVPFVTKLSSLMSRFQTEESIGTWTEAVNSAVFKGLSGLTSSEAIELMKKGLSIYMMKIYIASDCSGLD